MFKSVKKVLVGVLAASLMLTSVAFAADSPSKAPEVPVVNEKNVTKIDNVKTVELGAKVTTIKKNALQKKTTSLTIIGAKKVTVKKNAFANANKKLVITVDKNKVTFKKGAFGKKNTKKMTIRVKGLKKKAFKKYAKALKAAGFKGKIVSVK